MKKCVFVMQLHAFSRKTLLFAPSPPASSPGYPFYTPLTTLFAPVSPFPKKPSYAISPESALRFYPGFFTRFGSFSDVICKKMQKPRIPMNAQLLRSVFKILDQRNAPVLLCALALISSGVPAATIVPPSSPPPGPISMT